MFIGDDVGKFQATEKFSMEQDLCHSVLKLEELEYSSGLACSM